MLEKAASASFRTTHFLIENDHLGDWSPEKDCCWRMRFRQPMRKLQSQVFTLKIASTQVVETSVAYNSPQDSSHSDDHFQSSYGTAGFKQFS